MRNAHHGLNRAALGIALRRDFVPAIAEHHEVAVGIQSRRVIHPIRLRLMLRDGAELFPRQTIRTAPAIHIALGSTVVGLIENDGDERAIVELHEVRPRADFVDGDEPSWDVCGERLRRCCGERQERCSTEEQRDELHGGIQGHVSRDSEEVISVPL